MIECPHKDEQYEVNMNVQITLLSSRSGLIQKSLALDSLGKELLDTRCSKTVASHTCLKEFLDTISLNEAKTIKKVPSKFVF